MKTISTKISLIIILAITIISQLIVLMNVLGLNRTIEISAPLLQPLPQQPTDQTVKQPLCNLSLGLTTNINWVRKNFNNVWDIEYPEGWVVNERGIEEGRLEMEGELNGINYLVAFGYPIFDEGRPLSLDGWLDKEMQKHLLTSHIKIVNTQVGDTPAKIIFFGVTANYSECLIWAGDNKNPRAVEIITKGSSPENLESFFIDLISRIK